MRNTFLMYFCLKIILFFFRCWEDFYWNCIEEKFCYDESIGNKNEYLVIHLLNVSLSTTANYNPEDDEFYCKKTHGGGFLAAASKLDNNNRPVCLQPSSAGSQRKGSNIRFI